MSALTPRPVSPDCASGKHEACVEDAWDDQRDQITWCRCPCHDDEAIEHADEEGR